MVTMAQRIEELRNEKGMSRPELASVKVTEVRGEGMLAP